MGFELLGLSFALSLLGLVIKMIRNLNFATMGEILCCNHLNEVLLEERFAKSYLFLGTLQNEI